MANCRYCTAYHLNSHERIDDCCLGYEDCKREHFTCNENLKPKAIAKKDDVQEFITELEKRGYTVTR